MRLREVDHGTPPRIEGDDGDVPLAAPVVLDPLCHGGVFNQRHPHPRLRNERAPERNLAP